MDTPHVVILYAGIAGLLLLALSFNVMQQWARVTRQGLAQDGDLRRAEKLLGSFAEYVPLMLILIFLLENRGAPAYVLHSLGIALIMGRLLHAFGTNRMAMAGFMRFAGAQLTYLAIMVASLACIYHFAFFKG